MTIEAFAWILLIIAVLGTARNRKSLKIQWHAATGCVVISGAIFGRLIWELV